MIVTIQIYDFKLDAKQKELEVRGTPMFPCAAYYSDIVTNVTGDIPWHWHEEIETLIVCKGTVKIGINGMYYLLKAGDGMFINSNVLHSAIAVGDEECMLHSLVFHSNLISGVAESIFEQRYVRPLLHANTLTGLPLYQQIPWQQDTIECISDAYEFYAKQEFGYELCIREKLTHLWFLMVKHHQDKLEFNDKSENQDTARIKMMLGFIHEHYRESIDVKQIANSARISERECLRCFKRMMGTPPIKYLLKYRIQIAARLLIETDKSVTEICQETGFDSPSYFSKVFKQWISYTPKEYRNKHKSQ